jgi:hypothetical protein
VVQSTSVFFFFLLFHFKIEDRKPFKQVTILIQNANKDNHQLRRVGRNNAEKN